MAINTKTWNHLAVITVVIVGLLTITGLIAFNDDLGINKLKSSLNGSSDGTNSYSTLVSTLKDAATDVCDATDTGCLAQVKDFNDKMNALKLDKDGSMGLVQPGYMLRHYFEHLKDEANFNKNNSDTRAFEAAFTALKVRVDAFTYMDRVSSAVTAIFSLLIIYLVVILGETYKRLQDGDNMFKRAPTQSVLYWFTHLHVFVILILTIFVFNAAYSSDFFVEQIEDICYPNAVAPALTNDPQCLEDGIKTIHDHIWFLMWTLFVFSVAYVSSHFTLRHGPEDTFSDAVLHVMQGSTKLVASRASGVGTRTAKKIVNYVPLQSVHR
jgi:hypothetical protein